MFNLSACVVCCACVCVCICVAHKQLQTQMVFTYLYDFTRNFFAVIVFTFCVLTHLNIVCTFHFPSQHFYRMNLLAIRLFSLFRICFSLYFRSLSLFIFNNSFIRILLMKKEFQIYIMLFICTHTLTLCARGKNIQTNCFNA